MLSKEDPTLAKEKIRLVPGSESSSAARVVASLTMGRSYLSGELRGPSSGEIQARNSYMGLLTAQQTLLSAYFHLQRSERALHDRVLRKRRGNGRRALRQIELERQRLGRELHTGVGQVLAAIRLQLDIISAQLPLPQLPVAQALERISKLTHDAMGQVRAVAHRLHPPEWQRLTIEEALRQLWQVSGIPESFLSEMRIEALPDEPDLEVKVLTYRALQEAISNLARHAKATRVGLTLQTKGNWLVLTIQDNGVGFDTAHLLAKPAGPTSGIGLRAIREQAQELGGKLVVVSGPHGTTLELSLPFHPSLDS